MGLSVGGNAVFCLKLVFYPTAILRDKSKKHKRKKARSGAEMPPSCEGGLVKNAKGQKDYSTRMVIVIGSPSSVVQRTS